MIVATMRPSRATYYPMTVKKHLRAQDIVAAEQSALRLHGRFRWRFLPMQLRSSRRRHFGGSFYNQAQMSARVFRKCHRDGVVHGGRAYVPAMSDESIIVRNQGTIFLGGRRLVKAATGEVVTARSSRPTYIQGNPAVTITTRRTTRTAIGSRGAIVATLNSQYVPV